MNDIYQIIQRLDNIERPRQTPALFKPVKVDEAVATEDVLSTVKKKLTDYLKTIETEMSEEDETCDSCGKPVDKCECDDHTHEIAPASVKTIMLDDGTEMKIVGNESTGFNIQIKEKTSKTSFATLDEAEMAVGLFQHRQARRQEQVTAEESAESDNNDYLEER